MCRYLTANDSIYDRMNTLYNIRYLDRDCNKLFCRFGVSPNQFILVNPGHVQISQILNSERQILAETLETFVILVIRWITSTQLVRTDSFSIENG